MKAYKGVFLMWSICALIFTVVYSVSHPSEAMDFWFNTKNPGWAILTTIPLMLFMFYFFKKAYGDFGNLEDKLDEWWKGDEGKDDF